MELPTEFAPLADYDDPMAAAMTPLLGVYWEAGGKQVRERLGLDADEWKVTDLHVQEMIERAAFAFCKSTNATTTKHLNHALGLLRDEIKEGLIEEGEGVRELTKRVRRVFEHAETWRAQMIAATEAARAVHAAELVSAQESGVVAGFKWLVSGDACPLCQMIAAEVGQVRLGDIFARIGHNATYADIKHPPAHPHCQCTVVEVLLPDYGGPASPAWGQPLDQPKPPDDYEPPAGKTPKPDPDALKPKPIKPKPIKPKPKPKPEEEDNELLLPPPGTEQDEHDLPLPPGPEPEPEPKPEPPAKPKPPLELPPPPERKPGEAPLDYHLRKIAWAYECQRLEAAHAEVEGRDKVPHLLAAGPIGDRIKANRVGKAKVAALKDVLAESLELQTQVDVLRERLKHANAEVDRITSLVLTGQGGPDAAEQFAKAKAASKKATKDLMAVGKKLTQRQASDREQLLKVLKVDAPLQVGLTPGRPTNAYGTQLDLPGGQDRDKAKEAAAFLTQIVHRADQGAVEREFGIVPVGAPQRSHASDQGFGGATSGYVQLSMNVRVDIFVHEAMHMIEAETKLDGASLGYRAGEFLDHRNPSAPTTNMDALFPGVGFSPKETTKDVGLFHVFGEREGWYAGRDYRPSPHTELLSQGAQHLYGNPSAILKDEEYATFLFGVLDGSIR